MQKLKMSYDEYDELMEKFEKIKETGAVPVCWPTILQIDKMREENSKDWLLYCCYLHEFNPEPETNEQKYSRRNMAEFINDYLELE